jgi:hypothetical protein
MPPTQFCAYILPHRMTRILQLMEYFTSTHAEMMDAAMGGCCKLPDRIETYGHLGRPIMRYLRTLSDDASAGSLAVTRGSFLATVHRERSVALLQSQGYVYRSCSLLLAKACRQPVLPEVDTPNLECELCSVCGVCVLVVSYHLVLFSVLSVPCAYFPSLQFILVAIRALVDCEGSVVASQG